MSQNLIPIPRLPRGFPHEAKDRGESQLRARKVPKKSKQGHRNADQQTLSLVRGQLFANPGPLHPFHSTSGS